jgi:opacity protein-like surface antigen
MRDAKKFVAAALIALAFFGLGLNRAAAEGWNGPYVGANLGMGFNSFNFDDVNYRSGGDRRVQNSNSFVPGLKAGYNRRFGSTVVGGEAEYDGSFGAHSHQIGVTSTPEIFMGDLNSLLALRGRAGVLPSEHALVYMTVGAVYAESTQQFQRAAMTWRWNGWNWGLIAGVGMEFEFTHSVTLTSEYLHGYFIPKYVQGDAGTAGYLYAMSPSLDIVRVGMNYRFGF